MEKNTNVTETSKKKKTKYERAVIRRKIVNSIMGVIIFCAILGCCAGVSTVKLILDKSDVVLETEDLASTDSSLIFDDAGNQIAMVGNESRISIAYNKFPQALIDAFVAVEDSRFFEHSGFDIPRFAKAFLINLKTLSFEQGGSTITMQVIKNTYFAVDTIAETSIARKVQEIFFSTQITKSVTKEKILEMYINKVNYGSTARGVQVAAKYYFGKDATNLSLVECAMLAGVVNSPNSLNPYYHLQDCQERTATVLYQMYNHGYITEDEYRLALSVKLENLLVGNKVSNGNNLVAGEEDGTISNQAYIDIVLNEIEEVYGIDPYVTPVRIYTAMNQTVQSTCDAIARGEYINFKDENINVATAVIQNYTGLIVGVCGGRNYNGERIYNYASDARISPGSTSKAMFTYPLAFEYCGMSTSYTILDEPIYYSGTSIRIFNDSGGYHGESSVQLTLPMSYNVPSVKLYRWISETVGADVMRQYLRNIGYDEYMVSNMNEQYAIGCNGYDVSPIQMAAAQSMILSGGKYTQPHTITRIEYISSDKEPIVANFTSVQALSEGAAWLTSYLEKVGVNGGTEDDYVGNGRLTMIRRRAYTVYGKTGTNGYDSEVIKQWGYPYACDKELLYLCGTNDYSFSFWMGYDTGRYQDKTTYISYAYAHACADVPAVNAMIDSVYEAFGAPVHTNPKPSDVVSITHVKGLYPYTSLPEYATEDIKKRMTTTGYILKDFANVEAWPTVDSIASLSSFKASYDEKSQQLTVNFAEYPDPEAMIEDTTVLEMKLGTYTYKGKRRYSATWIDGVVNYFFEVVNNDTGEVVYSGNGVDALATYKLALDYGNYTVRGYYAYTIAPCQSNVIEVKFSLVAPEPEPEPEPQPEVNPGENQEETPEVNPGESQEETPSSEQQ